MNDIKVKIVFIPSTKESITYRITPPGNNINAIYTNIALSNFYKGAKPFILGASKLGQEDVFRAENDKYNGFIHNELTGVNGEANCEINISGTEIDNFALVFDRMAQQWAAEIYVDNVFYENDDPQFVWQGKTANMHKIKITKWNLPLYPVRITSISVGLTMEFDSSNLKEVLRGSQIVAENVQPKYGVISQYGSIEIYDYDGELLDLNQMGLLLPDQNIEIWIDREIIGKFYSDKWSISGGVAKVELTDKLIKWQDILFKGYSLKEEETAQNVFSLLNDLIGYAVNINEADKTYLSTLIIKYNYLESSTLFEAWNKFCEITQMNIFTKEDGEIWSERI